MQLEGSCHCGAVHFSVNSTTPYPYQRCYCSICRKTQGGGGYAINLGADASTMKVKGADDISVYHAKFKNPGDERTHTSTGQRHFCRRCGSALWLYDPTWPELIHPFASAIDTPLPIPPEHTHLMLDFKAPWVEINATKQDKQFDIYPEESIAEWHERLGLTKPD
ncbi:MAG: GFA family protein [Herminiimonas sp.]|uniref:GFA family protein n=1 Tax=Herminiimonas sp. TaxID=1926289 RepID=UPI002726B13E|nr:GFA family protein [Herminiimonas sp.]MDO9420235.1 GFA family protein [Herminiimonas sp.]